MKRILAVLLVLAMVFSLAACSKDEDKKPDNNNTNTGNTTTDSGVLDKEITLTLWDIAVEGDGNRPAYDSALADLKAKYPKVTINETVTENNAYKTKIKSAMGANELPDIFFTWSCAFLGDFVSAGKVYCLDEALAKYKDELPEDRQRRDDSSSAW